MFEVILLKLVFMLRGYLTTDRLWIIGAFITMYPIVTGSEGGGQHVRCYCNLPSCITTGYMCKSPKGGCYSELVPDLSTARRGCIGEDPNVELAVRCINSPGRAAGAWGTSLLLCCFSDLCNHVDSLAARVRINDSLTGANNLSGMNGLSGGSSSGAAPALGGGAESPGELWFRAATIAVPICGALILFVLIALAIRILRTDTLDASHKLSATYNHQVPGQGPLEQPLMKKSPILRGAPDHLQPTHTPLLLNHANVMHPSGDPGRERYIIAAKNEVNANMNLAATSERGSRDDAYIIMQHCPQPEMHHSSQSHKPSNTDLSSRDVNINIQSQHEESNVTCPNVKLYEKQRLPPDDKLYNKETILYWGQAAANANHCPR